jgi:hypothetical protein
MNRWLTAAAAGAGAYWAYRALTNPGVEHFRGKSPAGPVGSAS